MQGTGRDLTLLRAGLWPVFNSQRINMKPQTKHQTKHMKAAPLKKMTSDFASTFEAFKDANDARLAALESKQGDSLLNDKVARINAALDSHCLLYTSPSPRDKRQSRMPSSA